MEILKKYGLTLVIIGIWCGVTLFQLLSHSPWYDEAHAWNIAQALNIIELIKYMQVEGHTILWYLCIMPFAKFNIAYPYSMLLVNWMFCFIAIIILWQKAPFNKIVKLLITFSFPFLSYYPVVARCYSIGIMILFMVLSLDKDKMKHCNIYAILLVLLANTSVLALVGATVLGIFFIIELIKQKAKNIIPYLILLSGSVLIFIQLGQCLGKENELIGFLMRGQTFLDIFNSTFFVSNLYLNISIVIVAIIGLIIFFIANKIFPWLLVSTTVFLFITYAFIYNGAFWHYFFIYIYFIASLWLVYQRKKDLKLKILPQILLGAISILLIFWNTNPKYYDYIYNYNYEQIAQQISQDVNLSKSKLVGVYMLPESLGPYLQNKNMEIYYMCSARPYLKFYETRNRCLYGQEVNFNVLDKNYDKDGTFLLLSSDYSPNDKFYRIYSNNYVDYYDLILYKFIEDIAIFKIIKSK